MKTPGVSKKIVRGQTVVPVVAFALLMVLNLFTGSAVTRAAAWVETGFNPNSESCVDGTQPNTLLYNNYENASSASGTYSYNWQTGQKTLISHLNFEVCDSYSGYLFAHQDNHVSRFSSREAERTIAYYPVEIGKDASQQMYTYSPQNFYSSRDDGLTWQTFAPPWTVAPNYAAIITLKSVPGDARSVYLSDCAYHSGADCTLYFSSNAGQTWEKRSNSYTDKQTSDGAYLETIEGVNVPVGYTLISDLVGNTYHLRLSTDGGYSFNDIGSYKVGLSPSSTVTYQTINLYYTGRNLVRFTAEPDKISLDVSDNGKTWTSQPLPPGMSAFDRLNPPYLAQLPFVGQSFSLSYVPQGSTAYSAWFTSNNGGTWNKIADSHIVSQVTPYQPTSLLSFDGGNLAVLDYPQADHLPTGGVASTDSANQSYYPQTSHTLSGAIRSFWESHGGLAQFGYPQTEVIREYNPADGKVYAVQYFERNRFEYHPELAGTPYEVELGLLGNQLTAERHNEAPFKAVPNPSQAGFLYFSQTGHTLAHTFKDYWESHGGLAIYGYPISEEFQEVNPSDGKTYTVQYFERNRFEYHPENKNTPYEVELGLLGNQLLIQKGWLAAG